MPIYIHANYGRVAPNLTQEPAMFGEMLSQKSKTNEVEVCQATSKLADGCLDE